MMAPKSTSRTWHDVQLTIAAIAMTGTLTLWNLFAGPDREAAARKAAQEAQATPLPTETPIASLSPTPMPIVKIIFGNGSSPQSSSSPQSGQADKPKKGKKDKGGGDGGGGGGGGGGSTGGS